MLWSEGLQLVRPGLNVIVEFFGIRLPKHVHVLKFMGFCRNEGRERENKFLFDDLA